MSKTNDLQPTNLEDLQIVKNGICDFFVDYNVIEMLKEANKIIIAYEQLNEFEKRIVLNEIKCTPVGLFFKTY